VENNFEYTSESKSSFGANDSVILAMAISEVVLKEIWENEDDTHWESF
jgi:hypothetical protein